MSASTTCPLTWVGREAVAVGRTRIATTSRPDFSPRRGQRSRHPQGPVYLEVGQGIARPDRCSDWGGDCSELYDDKAPDRIHFLRFATNVHDKELPPSLPSNVVSIVLSSILLTTSLPTNVAPS